MTLLRTAAQAATSFGITHFSRSDIEKYLFRGSQGHRLHASSYAWSPSAPSPVPTSVAGFNQQLWTSDRQVMNTDLLQRQMGYMAVNSPVPVMNVIDENRLRLLRLKQTTKNPQ